MATVIQSPTSIELFYSYAHTDEPLCKELEKHLAALKRAGLIRGWYDREIKPGDEWESEIHTALERASIILLLVSADFLASKYIFEVELPFALQRHQSGSARVIPVLLRPVEWRDSPFAKLQVLPSGARPVTLWTDQDEAFSDVAGRLRELLYTDRLHQVQSSPRASLATYERVLDAAIASSLVLGEPTDLVTMVRGTESGGLRAILQVDRTYSPTSSDVQSDPFELEFPSNEFGIAQPMNLELHLDSPGFAPPNHRKTIRISPAVDSSVSVFMLTPTRTGTLRLNLQVLSAGVEIGARALATRCVPAAEAHPLLSYGVSSVALQSSLSDLRVIKAKTMFETGDAPSHASLGPPDVGYTGSIRASAPMPAPPPQSAQPRPAFGFGKWMGVGSAAAVLALVSTVFLWNGNNTSVPGPAPITDTQKSPEIEALNDAIKLHPTATALYVKRAEEYRRTGKFPEALRDAERATKLSPADVQARLSYAELLDKAHSRDQALQEYRQVLALNPAPKIRSIATKRIAALESQAAEPKH